MEMTKRAIILAAGEGKRLKPFTLTNPKCFAQVGGQRIIDSTLLALAENGCKVVRIVVGHFAELIQTTIGNNFAGIRVEYINNIKYKSTNSMYSLALALDGWDEPTYIIEGDVCFESTILNMSCPNEISWFVDSSAKELDGAYVESDSHCIASSLEIVRDVNKLSEGQSKSIGILNLKPNGIKSFREWLRNGIDLGQENDYYDLILGDNMEKKLISTVDVAGQKWFEVDTAEDLEKANQLFSKKPKPFKFIEHQDGNMKTVMIVIDGLGDEAIPELQGRTPLEVAHIPNIHYIANRGQIGRIQTTFPGYPIESMVCIMGLLGYEPEKYYPSGRASFEAMAKGIPLKSNDIVLRCNLITIDVQKQVIKDFTAGLIEDSHARTLISQINLPYGNWELYPGQSYRNILIIRGANADASTIKCSEPHMHIGGDLHELLPKGINNKGREIADQIGTFLLDTQRQIHKMELPNNCKANMLWVWSPSMKPVWPTFKQLTGLEGAVVGGLDFVHGIAMAAGMHFDVIPGATGYIDTDYSAKAKYTIDYLNHYDFIMTHINATDEEAHQRNFKGKIDAIEKIDQLIVGPILNELVKKHGDKFKILVCGDHGTRCNDGKHTPDPVPFALYGSHRKASNIDRFCEGSCAIFEPYNSLSLIDELLARESE